MKKYLLILGNSPELAKEELKSLLKFNETLYQPPVLVIFTDEAIPFDKLGGTVKVGEVIETSIIDYLKGLGRSSVDFGVSVYAGKGPDPKEIKAELRDLGIKVRFVLPREGRELSSVVVKKQKLEEFLIFNDLVAHTAWVQDFEDWNKRDYGRPEVEAHIGMLPPKVARMMVNIGGGETVLDPFCGVGTILMEALVIGRKAIGSDIDPRQIERTKKNLQWLGQPAELFVTDARKISGKVKEADAIVTEPYLGPDSKPLLENLYLDCLQDWKNILKSGAKVVIALPSFGSDNTLVKNVVDKAQSIGYIHTTGPLIYARPQAKVSRNIVVFTNGTH